MWLALACRVYRKEGGTLHYAARAEPAEALVLSLPKQACRKEGGTLRCAELAEVSLLLND